MIHILPFLTTVGNFIVTDIVFMKSHGFKLSPLGLVYLLLNYISTKRTGEPVYSFLPWNSISSLFVGLGILGFSVFLYEVFVYVTN